MDRTDERLVIGDIRVTLKPEHYDTSRINIFSMVISMTCYKFVTDDREPVMVMHQGYMLSTVIEFDRSIDTSYPGILIKYENGYLLEDGVHRVAVTKQGIFESLFYIVTLEEYAKGIVPYDVPREPIPLGEWNNNKLSPMSH